MDFTNEHFLWASCVWGAVASGYFIYGWRQKASIPFAAAGAMTVASCLLPAFWMSLVCVAIMLAAWWLLRRGY